MSDASCFSGSGSLKSLSELAVAALRNDISLATTLLSKDTEKGVSEALKFAIQNGSNEMTTLLTGKLDNVNKPDSAGMKPLDYLFNGCFSAGIFDVLLKSGADVGQSLIQMIVRSKNRRAVEIICDNKIPLDVPDKYSMTHEAVSSNDHLFVKFVIGCGGDATFVFRKISPMKNALKWSVDNDVMAMSDIRLVISSVSIFQRRFAVPLELIKCGAMPDVLVDECGTLALLFSLLTGQSMHSVGSKPLHIKLKKFFTGNECDEEFADFYDSELLHIAARYSPVSVVERLITKGFDIDAPDGDGLRPIHHGIMECQFENVKVLIDSCASVQSPSVRIPSLLHLMAENYEMMRMECTGVHHSFEIVSQVVELLKNEIMLCNFDGETAFDVACKTGNMRLAELLLRICDLNQNGGNELFLVNLLNTVRLEDQSELTGQDINRLSTDDLPERFVSGRVMKMDDMIRMMSLYFSCNSIDDIVLEQKKENILHIVCTVGNATLVRFLLQNGLDIDARNEDGMSPIALAVKSRKLAIVKELMKFSPNVNSQDVIGRTPFMYACAMEGTSLLLEMVAAGANCTLRDMKQRSVLHFAAKHGNVQALKYLINSKKLSPLDSDRSRRSPIHVAARYGRLDAVKFLWNSGIDKLRDNEGNTALHYAVRYNCIDVVKFISSSLSSLAQERNHRGETPLTIAATQRNKEIVDFLFSLDVKFSSSQSFHALRGAVDVKDVVFLEKLLNHGLVISTREWAYSILDYIAENNMVDVLSCVSKMQIIQARDDLTPILIAYVFGYNDMFDVLMSMYQIDNVQIILDALQRHDLLDYVQNRERDTIEAVCRLKTNESGKCRDGLLSAVSEKNEERLIAIFKDGQDPNARLNVPLIWEVKEHISLVNILLSFGANPDIRDGVHSHSLLYGAIEHNNVELFGSLLRAGANLNNIDDNKTSSLSLAIQQGTPYFFRVLIYHGADVNAVDQFLRRPLHYAAESNDPEYAKMLLVHGAVDAKGDNACALAMCNANPAVTKVFLDMTNTGR